MCTKVALRNAQRQHTNSRVTSLLRFELRQKQSFYDEGRGITLFTVQD